MALTDEQIIEIRKTERAVVTTPWGDTLAFSRAIEAAAVAPLLARIAALTVQVEQAAQPVTHQFQARDGSWHGFIDESHMENTIKDGSWPIRALYTAPPKAVPRPLTTRELADVTAPWANVWTDQSFGIANAAIAKFCEVNGIAQPKPANQQEE